MGLTEPKFIKFALTLESFFAIFRFAFVANRTHVIVNLEFAYECNNHSFRNNPACPNLAYVLWHCDLACNFTQHQNQ